MGLAMAINLQKYLTSINAPALAYHNRTMARGEPLIQLGGTPYESVGELVDNADMVFISVRTLKSSQQGLALP